ncbi:hypothetical protein BGZ47_001753 [Haplosporangium gracile]|nr:hypothetical protein BGZ47_001753 [Haplosporangium gracile]
MESERYENLFAICALNGTLALGDRQFEVNNNAGKTVSAPVASGRHCVCLQTAKIKHTNGGVMKLFSTDDCTGNYAVLLKGTTRGNVQWVSSASVGKNGIPFAGPYQCDPVN